MKKITVKGMSCGHCQSAVKEALEELGLTGVEVNLETGAAVFDEADVARDKIAEAIDDAGFEVNFDE